MNKYLKRVINGMALLFFLLWSGNVAAAPVDLSGRSRAEALDSVVAGYFDWSRISLSGKLRSSVLPMSVNVKIYMEKDSLMRMSISAPFVGEAARVEITPDSAVVVNKLKRRYAVIPMSEVRRFYPGTLADIQNLLLGRVAVFGVGTLSSVMEEEIRIIDDGSDVLAILPAEKNMADGLAYAYAFDRNICRLRQFVVYSGDADDLVEMDYSWKGKDNKDLTLSGQARIRNRVFDMQLALGAPESDGRRMEAFVPDTRYREVSLKEVVSF